MEIIDKKLDDLDLKYNEFQQKMGLDIITQSFSNFQSDMDLLKKENSSLKVLIDKILANNNPNINNSLDNILWENGQKIYNVQTSKGTTYYPIKSQNNLNNEFIVKVKILNLDEKLSDIHWHHSFGLIKSDSQNINDFYSDSLLILSSQFKAKIYSGSQDCSIKLFYKSWSNGDILILTKNTKGEVYYGVNDINNLKLVFSDIFGSFKLVMGVSKAITNFSIEIL